ncbi:unnamed protein product [Prunus brigantina]
MLPQALLLVILMNINVASTSNIIKTLPSFRGDFPFNTKDDNEFMTLTIQRYVGVGAMDDVQLFYYFFESEGSPEYDPLVLWFNGGPGCSTFSGFLNENLGPLSFDYLNSIGNKPKLKLNPYSWTKVANIIFVDEPVGTGFSYAKTWEGYSNIRDTLSAVQTYEFLRKMYTQGKVSFLIVDHEVLIWVYFIYFYVGNRDEHLPPMNLKGYVIGNPVTDTQIDKNYRVLFACLKALIPEELCQCIEDIHLEQILEPVCSVSSPKSAGSKWFAEYLVNKDSANLLLSFPQLRRSWCRSYNYLFSYIWANDRTVQDALHIREGSIKEWERCNKTLQDLYISDVSSSLVYHENLIKQGYRVLIYSGDHDMNIPYVSTMGWIESLNLTVDSRWKPWFLHGQVAGLVSSISSSFLLCIEFSRRNLNPIRVLNVATEASLEFRAISPVPAARETKTSTGKMLAVHLPSLGLLRLISMGLGRLVIMC